MAIEEQALYPKARNFKKKSSIHLKKDWYDIKAPSIFARSNDCKPRDKPRVRKNCQRWIERSPEVCLADLNKDSDRNRSENKLCCEDVRATTCHESAWTFTRATSFVRL
jgi:ribosomal protein S3AE